MATTTATSVLASVVSATSATASPTGNRAPPQGGILEGQMPNTYSASDPIKLFIIQVRSLTLPRRTAWYP